MTSMIRALALALMFLLTAPILVAQIHLPSQRGQRSRKASPRIPSGIEPTKVCLPSILASQYLTSGLHTTILHGGAKKRTPSRVPSPDPLLDSWRFLQDMWEPGSVQVTYCIVLGSTRPSAWRN